MKTKTKLDNKLIRKTTMRNNVTNSVLPTILMTSSISDLSTENHVFKDNIIPYDNSVYSSYSYIEKNAK